jgi:FkbM family methyltransferase
MSCAAAFGKTRVGRVVSEQVVEASMRRTRNVTHRGTELTFCVPNGLNHFRVQTFSSKEPETLEWIESIPEGSVLWDVGANIGLYSCYAAKARRCRVIAFEPSVFNLELLARNILLNRLTDKITIMSLPLSEVLAENTLNLTTTSWGGALSAFGVTHGFDGREIDKVFEFRALGLSMDDAVNKLGLPRPDYIKLDVDGIEHMILRGGREVLAGVLGVSVEINDGFEIQAAECRRLLESSGLRLVSKAHSDVIEKNAAFDATFNQAWAR